MRGYGFSSSLAVLNRLNTNWTCSRCSSRLPFLKQSRSSIRHLASKSGSQTRRRIVLWATTGGGGTLAGFFAFGEDARIAFGTLERTGRVAGALVVCINDYRSTLKKRDRIEDPEEKKQVLKACHKRCAEKTLKVLEKNGGVFIKLGQHLSAMNYLLPPEWTITFIPLQDRCPVSSLESIEKLFKQDTEQELWEYFSEFSPEPIGAASLAQVHMATIKETGQRVAVKVQHPGLAQWAPLDMILTRYTFSTLKRFFPEYDLEWLSSEMELSLPKELDFQCEAHNALATKSYFARFPELPLVIPDVIWAKKRILVMACESGHRLDDLAYLDAQAIDRDEVSATLARIFNEMIFGRGAPLHCDPHGGNIAIRKRDMSCRSCPKTKANFDIILYDHGLYRDIPETLRVSYAKMWLAIIDGDMDRTRTYVKEIAHIDDNQFPLFASAITGRDFSVLSSDSIVKPRTKGEKNTMSTALQEGLLADLVQLLGQVPRVILLILKTNDLTRSLDESLHTRQGPLRQFLILARYAARTVFHDEIDAIKGLWWTSLRSVLRLFAVWWSFVRIELKLEAFELWLAVKRVSGSVFANGQTERRLERLLSTPAVLAT